MDSKTQKMIQQHLRRTWSYCETRKEVKKAARVELEKGKFKNGKVIMRVFYKCALCGDNFKSDDVAVDHVSPVGNFTRSHCGFLIRSFVACGF